MSPTAGGDGACCPQRPRAVRRAASAAAARGGELCFGIGDGRPFRPDRLQGRADAAWKQAGLERLTLHDCRRTYASLAIASGVNAKALSTYLGHASIQETFDRYGHLMPGNETEAATLMDATGVPKPDEGVPQTVPHRPPARLWSRTG